MRLILTTLLMLVSSFSIACSCDMGDVTTKFGNAERVFVGKVESVKPRIGKKLNGDKPTKVKFLVSKSWKGGSEKVVMHTYDNGASCSGYWFKKGVEYLVYAFEENGRLDTMYCGGVIPLNETEDFEKEKNELDKIAK